MTDDENDDNDDDDVDDVDEDADRRSEVGGSALFRAPAGTVHANAGS